MPVSKSVGVTKVWNEDPRLYHLPDRVANLVVHIASALTCMALPDCERQHRPERCLHIGGTRLETGMKTA